MPELTSRVTLRTIDNVALAYFSDPRRVSDSIRDLCTAGFAACNINISLSKKQTAAMLAGAEDDSLPNAIGSHSVPWKWNRSWQHDRHRRGADQLSGLNPTPDEGANPTCYSFDLGVVLRAMHVPAQVITLLQSDAQTSGQFMLVDATNRVPEADRILDGNAGYLRTQYLRVNAA